MQERAEAQRRENEAHAQRVRAEDEARFWSEHVIPHNLDLAVERQGNHYYFSQVDWLSLSAERRDGCEKLGVVIDKNNQKFILSLDLADGGRRMSWSEATRRFPNNLPDKAQGGAIASQNEAVRYAIHNFGGSNENTSFWTNAIGSISGYDGTQNYWYVEMAYGDLYHNVLLSSGSNRVRTVCDLPK